LLIGVWWLGGCLKTLCCLGLAAVIQNDPTSWLVGRPVNVLLGNASGCLYHNLKNQSHQQQNKKKNPFKTRQNAMQAI